MLALSALVTTLALTPAVMPRECTNCGVYEGPNVSRVLDPYLRQKNVWPEFSATTCQFEIARGSFVTLTRSACTSETSYRAAMRVPA